ncbi:MAG: carboxylating nicotinate-nucleotide diphosphorylase [Acidimicrobiales bacterium]|nr:carboxylating nicotinate-nucleotide diphosphorylase [Acidimicrobiales bacterium]
MSNPFEAPVATVRAAVERALAEDLTPLGDLTSGLMPAEITAVARFVSRQSGILAGRACADEAFRQVDPSLVVTWAAADGDQLEPGLAFGAVSGTLRTILTAERTALNFLGHLSGVATLVRTYVDAAGDGGARIWDTRKTTPGLRSLEKAAVRAGGGVNHRGNLSEWIMFKDNHLTGTTITQAVGRAKAAWPGRTVHVECERPDQVTEALAAGAGALLLDNMTPDEVRRCVALVDAWEAGGGARPIVEASGGIDLDTVAAYATTGVDLLSVGRLTNSAPVLDIGLDIAVDDVTVAAGSDS